MSDEAPPWPPRAQLFVATRLGDVPAGVVRYASVDGSVPGASVCWDHHQTGERTNLDALPEVVETSTLDGIGTTSADGDSVISAAVVLLGGRAGLPGATLRVLESAAHWCDHLVSHPAHDAEVSLRGRGLQYAIASRLSREGEGASQRFAAIALELAAAIRARAPLPFLEGWLDEDARAEELERAGRIQRRGDVALVDLSGWPALPPSAVHRRHRCAVHVVVDDHPGGGRRYVVGLNPSAGYGPDDVRPALAALAAAEHAAGPPCVGPDPAPGNENWGGRQVVGGSPWNYGSRLQPDDVVALAGAALHLATEGARSAGGTAAELAAWWESAERFACTEDERELPVSPPWARTLAEVVADEISFRIGPGTRRLDEVRGALPDESFRRVSRLLLLRLGARVGTEEALRSSATGLLSLLADLSAGELPEAESPTRARALHSLGATYLSLGDRAAAEVALYLALEGIGEGPARAWVEDTCGRLLQQTGAWEEARRLFGGTLLHKRRAGDRLGVAITAGNTARMETLLGAPRRAAAILRGALEETAGACPNLTLLRLETLLLEAELAEQRLDDAEATGTRVRERLASESTPQHALLGFAHLALGQLEAARGRSPIAEVEAARPHCSTADQRAWAQYCLLRDNRAAMDPSAWERALEALASVADPQTEAAVFTWLLLAEARHSDPEGRGACLARAAACAQQGNQPLLVHAVDRVTQKLDAGGYLDRVARRFTGRSGAELEATRRHEATMIFADMVRFTDISQVLEPEEVMSFSRGLFELAVPLLARFSVRPMTYLGDALFAAAEGPDHRERGLAFAYEFVARVRRVSAMRHAAGERLSRRSGEPWVLQIRAGVSTGEAVFGVLGNAFKEEFTAIGSKVNLAARLQSIADPEQVVFEDLGDPPRVAASSESATLKGFGEAIQVRRWRVSPEHDHAGRRVIG